MLDLNFRARGAEGLRVDGKFPRTPGAFPAIPTFMLSLKAADIILADSGGW
jgi:choline dehydrogenase